MIIQIIVALNDQFAMKYLWECGHKSFKHDALEKVLGVEQITDIYEASRISF